MPFRSSFACEDLTDAPHCSPQLHRAALSRRSLRAHLIVLINSEAAVATPGGNSAKDESAAADTAPAAGREQPAPFGACGGKSFRFWLRPSYLASHPASCDELKRKNAAG